MTVTIIKEESHGLIGVAKDRETAINYLIQTDWINSNTDFYDKEKEKFLSLKEMFGESWKEEIVKQNDDFFEGSFYFSEKNLIEN